MPEHDDGHERRLDARAYRIASAPIDERTRIVRELLARLDRMPSRLARPSQTVNPSVPCPGYVKPGETL